MAESVALIYKKTFSQIDALMLDVSISETHDGQVDVTEFPVEEGSNITDHVRPKPETLSITGLVTNHPFSDTPTASPLDTLRSLGQKTRSRAEPDRAGRAYEALKTLKDSGWLVTVVTGLRTYENMVMKSLSVPRDASTGQALRFTAQFQKVFQVESRLERVRLPKLAAKKDQGDKPLKEATEDQRRKSVLRFATGLFE